MKTKKNIIKKTLLSNKKFFINYRREFKFLLKKKNFKFKKFNTLLLVFYTLKKILKTSKYFRHNLYKTKNNLLINKTIYFNYITNGLDLKYDNQYQELYVKDVFISNYLMKNSLISIKNDLNIVKLQKFLTIIDNFYIDTISNEESLFDYFVINNFIFYNLFFEIYKINILNILLKIN